jgi:hypothetical protein
MNFLKTLRPFRSYAEPEKKQPLSGSPIEAGLSQGGVRKRPSIFKNIEREPEVPYQEAENFLVALREATKER